MHDSVTPALKAFGLSIGIEGLTLDEDQSCTLIVDDLMFTLQWKSESQALLVYAPVGQIDMANPNTAQLLEILEANCLGMGTGGLALGLQPSFGAVVLSGQLPTRNLEPVVLEHYITFFVEMALEWTGRLKQAQNDGQNPAEASGMPPGIRV